LQYAEHTISLVKLDRSSSQVLAA